MLRQSLHHSHIKDSSMTFRLTLSEIGLMISMTDDKHHNFEWREEFRPEQIVSITSKAGMQQSPESFYQLLKDALDGVTPLSLSTYFRTTIILFILLSAQDLLELRMQKQNNQSVSSLHNSSMQSYNGAQNLQKRYLILALRTQHSSHNYPLPLSQVNLSQELLQKRHELIMEMEQLKEAKQMQSKEMLHENDLLRQKLDFLLQIKPLLERKLNTHIYLEETHSQVIQLRRSLQEKLQGESLLRQELSHARSILEDEQSRNKAKYKKQIKELEQLNTQTDSAVKEQKKFRLKIKQMENELEMSLKNLSVLSKKFPDLSMSRSSQQFDTTQISQNTSKMSNCFQMPRKQSAQKSRNNSISSQNSIQSNDSAIKGKVRPMAQKVQKRNSSKSLNGSRRGSVDSSMNGGSSIMSQSLKFSPSSSQNRFRRQQELLNSANKNKESGQKKKSASRNGSESKRSAQKSLSSSRGSESVRQSSIQTSSFGGGVQPQKNLMHSGFGGNNMPPKSKQALGSKVREKSKTKQSVERKVPEKHFTFENQSSIEDSSIHILRSSFDSQQSLESQQFQTSTFDRFGQNQSRVIDYGSVASNKENVPLRILPPGIQKYPTNQITSPKELTCQQLNLSVQSSSAMGARQSSYSSLNQANQRQTFNQSQILYPSSHQQPSANSSFVSAIQPISQGNFNVNEIDQRYNNLLTMLRSAKGN